MPNEMGASNKMKVFKNFSVVLRHWTDGFCFIGIQIGRTNKFMAMLLHFLWLYLPTTVQIAQIMFATVSMSKKIDAKYGVLKFSIENKSTQENICILCNEHFISARYFPSKIQGFFPWKFIVQQHEFQIVETVTV